MPMFIRGNTCCNLTVLIPSSHPLKEQLSTNPDPSESALLQGATTSTYSAHFPFNALLLNNLDLMLAFGTNLIYPGSSHVYFLSIRIMAALKPFNLMSVFDKLFI